MTEPITLGALRKAAKNISLGPPPVMVLCHPGLETSVRDLPNFFVPPADTETKMLPSEIGRVEIFRFVLSEHEPPDSWSIHPGGRARQMGDG